MIALRAFVREFAGAPPREESNSDGRVIRVVPVLGGADEGDGYSSSGSMFRVPVGGDEDEEEGGYSSGGSVIRIPVGGANPNKDDDSSSECSVIRVPVDVNEDDGYTSDGSVVRVPVRNECFKCDVEGQEGQDRGTPRTPFDDPTAQAVGGKGAMDRDGGEHSASDQGGASHGPVNAMEMNLQAAAKYFAAKGGQSGASHNPNGAAAAEAQSNGSAPAAQKVEEVPQVGKWSSKDDKRTPWWKTIPQVYSRCKWIYSRNCHI